MVTQERARRRKASLHISIDSDLSRRLRALSEKMSIPTSHLASLGLSRAVIALEAELGITEVSHAKPAAEPALEGGPQC